jgi:hypothetical protein
MAQGRRGGSIEKRWLNGEEVTQWRRGGSMEKRWLNGEMVVQSRRGGSMEKRWLIGYSAASESVLSDTALILNQRCRVQH